MRISPSPTIVSVTFLCANPVAEFHGDHDGLPLRDTSQVGLLEPRIWATEREKFEKQSRRVNDAVSEAAKRTLPALGRGKRTNDFFKKATLEEKSNDEISELLDIQDFENMWLSLGEEECFEEQDVSPAPNRKKQMSCAS